MKVWSANLGAVALPFALLYLAGGWLLAALVAGVAIVVAGSVVAKRCWTTFDLPELGVDLF